MPTVLPVRKELFAHRISDRNEVTDVPQSLPACFLKQVIKWHGFDSTHVERNEARQLILVWGFVGLASLSGIPLMSWVLQTALPTSGNQRKLWSLLTVCFVDAVLGLCLVGHCGGQIAVSIWKLVCMEALWSKANAEQRKNKPTKTTWYVCSRA